MSICNILCLFLVILIFLHIFNSNTMEEYRGRRRRRGRRRWYGEKWGYRYSSPHRFRYWRWHDAPIWKSIPFWGPFSDTFCPTGCSNLGRGRWGCTNPGSGSRDCVFASDCATCGY